MRRELALVFASLLVAAACREPEAPVEPARRKVRCVVSERRDRQAVVVLRGVLAAPPEKSALVASQVPGVVASIEAREGDVVARGQVLARVDRATLSDALAQAEAALQRAVAERANADAALARARLVFEKGISSRQDVDDAAARAASLRAAVTEAEAGLAQAQRQVGRTDVRAPMPGVVVHLLRRPGELVDGTSGTAIGEVADLSQLELSASVPLADALRLQAGDTGTVHFATNAKVAWPAQLVRVAPAVERATGLVGARIALKDAPRVPLGTPGTAALSVGPVRAETWIPAEALRRLLGAEGEVVVCGADGRAHVQSVAPFAHGESALGVSGLDAGVPVVTDGVLGVGDGDALEVLR